MVMPSSPVTGANPPAHMVLYCLLRAHGTEGEPARFCLIVKQGHLTFPPTKLRPTEDLYHALVRPLEEDLGLPAGSYFPEEDLPTVSNDKSSKRYKGLTDSWLLYPVLMSLTPQAMALLQHDERVVWWTLDEVLKNVREPNVHRLAKELQKRPSLQQGGGAAPSMGALASHWDAHQLAGVRVLRGGELRGILAAGDRAFNLRVADPYLSYQRQGLGFTWSFFTPCDTQDLHVHAMPAVEIYGVMEGRLQLWHKPMNQRGVRTWQCCLLCPGDWVELEPLQCHFAVWLDPTGLGTVIKAAATGELAGVGRLGISGKTTCGEYCSVKPACLLPLPMEKLKEQFALPYAQRDWPEIRKIAEDAMEQWQQNVQSGIAALG